MQTEHHALRGTVNHSYDPAQGKLTLRGINSLPAQLFDIADDIRILDISGNHISELPHNFNTLHRLNVLFASYCNFEALPSVLASCAQLTTIGMRGCAINTLGEGSLPAGLQALILTDNNIGELPQSIGGCTALRKLMIAGNRLQALPKTLLGCRKLEIVRFSANTLSQSPDWLFDLPHLAWYGDSSNRYSSWSEIPEPQSINWPDLQVGKVLGRSANNIVYYAKLPSGQEMAVKVYGNHIVTDGLPADDIAASIRAGDRPGLIGGVAEVLHAPDNKQALLMPLIDQSFTSLAGPPSISSICRDTYQDQQMFSIQFIAETVRTVALAMRQLHCLGIMHGDLYAHNILSNSSGTSYVGDFGAASSYKPGSAAGNQREQIDVRAFGILVNELITRTLPASTEDPDILSSLQQLSTNCLDKRPSQRPSFGEICDHILIPD